LIVAQLAESTRDPKQRSRPYDWREFHPMERAAFLRSLEDAIPEATEEDLERLV